MGTLSGEVEGVVCQVEWVLCQEGAWVLCQVRWRGGLSSGVGTLSGGVMGGLSGEVEGVVCQVEWILCQEGSWSWS